jgi:hypothetical protein
VVICCDVISINRGVDKEVSAKQTVFTLIRQKEHRIIAEYSIRHYRKWYFSRLVSGKEERYENTARART